MNYYEYTENKITREIKTLCHKKENTDDVDEEKFGFKFI